MLRSAPMRFYPLLVFVFFFALSPVLYAESCSDRPLVEEGTACHKKHFTDMGKLYSCLNAYAENLLREDGVLNCQFVVGVKDFLGRSGANHLESYLQKASYTPLSEAFKIFIPEEQTDKGWCVEVDKDQVELLQEQIKSIAFFLKEYHIRSLGREPSLLFTIREVELCDYDREEILHYELKKLSIDLIPHDGSTTDPSPAPSFHLYSAENMWELWNGGQHYKVDTSVPPEEEKGWFNFEINLYPKVLEGMLEKMETLGSMSVSEQTDYLMYKTWGFLNPVGRLRTKIRLELAKKGLEKREEIRKMLAEKRDIFSYVLTKFEHSGLNKNKILEQFQKLSDSDKEKFQNLFIEKLTSFKDQARYIQCSLSASMEPEKTEDTTISRELDGSVVVTNAHFVDVKVALGNYLKRDDCVNLDEYRLPPSSKDEKEQMRSIHHKIRGVIIVDTFDQINIDLAMAPKVAGAIPLEINAFIEALQNIKEH